MDEPGKSSRPTGHPYTNAAIYRAISLEAHDRMLKAISAHRRPKEDGSEGWIISHDPNRASFKEAMIVIVFVGMWLEAILHSRIVDKLGLQEFKKIDGDRDRKTLEGKLSALGCDDDALIATAKRFRKARNELIHERAYLDKETTRFAQEEADHAVTLLARVEGWLRL